MQPNIIVRALFDARIMGLLGDNTEPVTLPNGEVMWRVDDRWFTENMLVVIA